MAQRKIERECSLNPLSLRFYYVLNHPENSIKSLNEIENMSVPDFLDYEEYLEMMSCLKQAHHKDEEDRMKHNK